MDLQGFFGLWSVCSASGSTFVTKIQRNIDHDSRATIAAFELFRILPVIAGAAALLDIDFHEALCYELHHQAQNINVGPFSASSARSDMPCGYR